MHRHSDAGFSRVALSHFQKASAKICPGDGIVRPQCEHAPIRVGRSGVFTIQKQNLSKPGQNIVPFRRRLQSAQE